MLLGGFTTNFIWCVLLNVKNRTGHQYFSPTVRDHAPGREQETIIETAIDAPSEEVVEHIPRPKPEPATVPLFWNYFFCALAGTTWYFQFFFYSMGETQMGKYKFSSWTLHMASIMIFSTLWGIALREWKGSSRRTITLVDARARRAGRLDGHRRLWQLSRDVADATIGRVLLLASPRAVRWASLPLGEPNMLRFSSLRPSVWLSSHPAHAAESPATADHLRCEYRVDPLGIDETLPRLFWQMQDTRRGAKQTAYQILVASTPEKLAADQGDLWDSGRVSSSETTQIVYAGKPLAVADASATGKCGSGTPTEAARPGASRRCGRWGCSNRPT